MYKFHLLGILIKLDSYNNSLLKNIPEDSTIAMDVDHFDTNTSSMDIPSVEIQHGNDDNMPLHQRYVIHYMLIAKS